MWSFEAAGSLHISQDTKKQITKTG